MQITLKNQIILMTLFLLILGILILYLLLVFKLKIAQRTDFVKPKIIQQTSFENLVEWNKGFNNNIIAILYNLKILHPLTLLNNSLINQELEYYFPDTCDAPIYAVSLRFFKIICLKIHSMYLGQSIDLWPIETTWPEDLPKTRGNLFVCMSHAMRQIDKFLKPINNWTNPHCESAIERMMRANSITIEDNQGTTTAGAFGNLVANKVLEYSKEYGILKHMKVENDWVNIDLLSKIQYGENTPYKLVNGHDWVNGLTGSSRFRNRRTGIVTQKIFVAPGIMEDSLFSKPNELPSYMLKSNEQIPEFFRVENQLAELKKLMDLVGPNNEYLTPQQVMIAEYSNNKHKAIESIIVHFCSTLTNLQLINNKLLSNMFALSSMVETESLKYAWINKKKYMLQRPDGALQYWLEKMDSSFSLLDEPNFINFSDIEKYRNWKSLIPGGDHPEYPSGSAMLYQTLIKCFLKYFEFTGLDYSKIPVTLVFKKGSSNIRPNYPEEDIVVKFPNISEYGNQLSYSRTYAGVHFCSTIDKTIEYANEMYEKIYYDIINQNFLL